jgi:hypothetical protein
MATTYSSGAYDDQRIVSNMSILLQLFASSCECHNRVKPRTG